MIFVENIFQRSWNKQDFVDMLKQVPFFLKKDGDHEILWKCKNEVELSKYVKKNRRSFHKFCRKCC